MLLTEPLAYVDLETTGANPLRDRITEVGVVLVDQGQVRQWQTLVNPETSIPPFIQNLTGINDSMVANAPTFAEIWPELEPLLANRLLIAHNVRFDYGFLRQEVARLGLQFHSRVLCTVQLSKKLAPEEYKHNLDTLIIRHNLSLPGDRHRALTDAVLLHQLIDVFRKSPGEEALERAVAELTQSPAWPAALDIQIMDDLPEQPGVFVCYGDQNQALFVGRGGNLRKEILAHFSGKRKKDLPLLSQTHRLEWVVAPGDFGAHLLEQKLHRELAPVYNPPLPVIKAPCCFEWHPGNTALQICSMDEPVAHKAQRFGPFRSRKEAEAALGRQADIQGLCRKVLGLENGPGLACKALEKGKCRGACIGREPMTSHTARLLAGMSRYTFPAWPWPGPVGLPEGPDWAPSLHVFEQWRYLGTIHDMSELDELLAAPRPAFDPDMMKLIRSEFKRQKTAIQPLGGH